MTAGFQAFTDTGVVQIDGLTPNYQLIATFAQVTQQESIPTVFNNVNTQFYATLWHTTFTFTASRPFFAFRADGGVMATPWKFSKIGTNTFTAEFISASQATIRLYVFDQVPVTANNFGLQVFDASGALIADAANPFTRVIDVIEGQYQAGLGWQASGNSIPGLNTQSKSYSVPVAFGGAMAAHFFLNTSPFILSAFGANGGAISWEFHQYVGNNSGTFVGFAEATRYRFMVLDMTGIT
ncbi:hypothetical protein SAMN05443245_3448 [Paraburkholderia fungorum]|uniref:Uncharacterized protein n=1 Tax=Paraburkholderia fungorum TaxID=134537 RepID=A0A1H1H1G2_9BURK|nr:hypothetical protein [Paraburkholderia fungorum]SDR19287.1 hypothetical protein SAMN05443245_3448 [Paraburkholderia fungorum]